MKNGAVAGAAAAAVLIAAIGISLHRRAADPDDAAEAARGQQRLPVLMIHGSGMNSSAWAPLTRRLRAAGWPADYLHAVDLVPDNGANAAAAERQLLPAARALLERAAARAVMAGEDPPARLAVLGHSMGAVSGRWLAARLIPERVAVFIAIAGSNHGSRSLCDRAGEGDRELCLAQAGPGPAELLRQLNGTEAAPQDETPYGPAADPAGGPRVPPTAAACIAWYAVLIAPDEWIVPATSARLRGTGGGEIRGLPAEFERIGPGEFALRASARHDDLPSTPAVMDLVTSLLALPVPACRR